MGNNGAPAASSPFTEVHIPQGNEEGEGATISVQDTKTPRRNIANSPQPRCKEEGSTGWEWWKVMAASSPWGIFSRFIIVEWH